MNAPDDGDDAVAVAVAISHFPQHVARAPLMLNAAVDVVNVVVAVGVVGDVENVLAACCYCCYCDQYYYYYYYYYWCCCYCRRDCGNTVENVDRDLKEKQT